MIGDVIKELRTSHKLTQEDLAKKMGLSTSTIGMYEQNRRVPDIQIIQKISNLFDVSTDFLLETTNDHITKNIVLSEEQRELLSYYEQLTRRNQRLILGKMVELLDAQEKSETDNTSLLEHSQNKNLA